MQHQWFLEVLLGVLVGILLYTITLMVIGKDQILHISVASLILLLIFSKIIKRMHWFSRRGVGFVYGLLLSYGILLLIQSTL
ncbi:MAG TPA: hypothetical protein ENG44_02765 [Desulfurococcaceae archaeon]|nr:hypothetical protein [Desulfurococcaceae archaeon]